MSHKRLWVASAIIASVILLGFVLSVPHTRDIDSALSPVSATTSVPIVALHDSFKKEVHTITGSIQAPNACTTVTAQASLLGDASNANEIIVALSMPRDSGVCLQIPTQANFTVTISAPAHLPITATVNGTIASTTAS